VSYAYTDRVESADRKCTDLVVDAERIQVQLVDKRGRGEWPGAGRENL